jgi:hypothetical protein
MERKTETCLLWKCCRFKHSSTTLGCDMTFTVFFPQVHT